MWQVTGDMWQVTCDRWHVTCNRLREVNIFLNFSSLALTAWEWRIVEYLEEKAHSLTELMNDEAVYRTAPATPGLLTRRGSPRW